MYIKFFSPPPNNDIKNIKEFIDINCKVYSQVFLEKIKNIKRNIKQKVEKDEIEDLK